MASQAELRAEGRSVLSRLSLTTEASARAFVPAATTSPPTSAPPSSTAHPLAEELAFALERADGDVEAMERVAKRARAELRHIIRRDLAPNLEAGSLADLGELIVSRGAGVDAGTVAISLRTSERIVRRARLAAGLDAERRRPVSVNGNGSRVEQGAELVAAGLCIRGAALVAGIPKSTLADGLRREARAAGRACPLARPARQSDSRSDLVGALGVIG